MALSDAIMSTQGRQDQAARSRAVVPGRRERPPVAWADQIWRVVSVGLAAVIALPVLAVAVTALTDGSAVWAHLWSTTLPEVLGNTGLLLLFVGTGTMVVGVATAWLVTMCRFPGSRALEILLLLPMAMPAFIIGYAYADLMAFAGPIQTALREWTGWRKGDYWFPELASVGGVSTLLTLVLYPYVYLLARSAFLEQSAGVLEAARTLGSGAWGAFWRVGLPLARPAIGAGVALAMMEAIADFGTVQYFGVTTFTTVIYRTWFGMGEQAVAAQLATTLLMFVLVLIGLELVSRGARGFHHTTRRLIPPTPARLTGWRAGLALLACALPVVLGFVGPVLIFIHMALDVGDPLALSRLLGYAVNSLTVASLAAGLLVGVAIVLAYAQRLDRSPITRFAVRIAGSGYAVPGSVVAVGILVPLGVFDNWVDGLARSWLGLSTGLLLSGTLAALIYGYLVRFLAVSLGPVEAGFAKIGRSLDGTARSLGASPWRVMARVHAPLLRGSVLTAALMVFVDVFKELPATLIVRPFNFDTLAVRVYNLASDERLAQASTGALLIVLVGLAPVLLLSWSIRHRRTRGADVRGGRA